MARSMPVTLPRPMTAATSTAWRRVPACPNPRSTDEKIMLETPSSRRDDIRVTAIRLHTVQTRRRTGAISSHILIELDTDAGITGVGEISDLDCYRRSEEHTYELQSLMRISYAVFCLKKKINNYRCN